MRQVGDKGVSRQIQIDLVALETIVEPRDSRRAGARPIAETVVLFTSANLTFGAATKAYLGPPGAELIKRAAAVARFDGGFGTVLDVLAPACLSADRLLVVGVHARASTKGRPASKDVREPLDLTRLGGIVAAKLSGDARSTILFDFDVTGPIRAVAEFSVGLRLRTYRFTIYKTKRDAATESDEPRTIVLAVADPRAADAAVAAGGALADGVTTARDLVNEPPNVLHPESFAERVMGLEGLGIEVEILDESAISSLGMEALIGVARGSTKSPRVVVMRWRGTKGGAPNERPIAFVGKGVTFDTGGISIKPSAGMEDMKGEMAGAACVVGLMQALAGRRAEVDVIGAIGIVENMPGPMSQRPGDIVTSMSGQTIEIVNTDAEGRLVLADVCWYIQREYDPRVLIDVASLTPTILTALGQEHAGLFSNDDGLAEQLLDAGLTTGEKLWRLPLAAAYDTLIESRFADMKNVGGPRAGPCTAAHFISRFVKDTPWAHLEIAGAALSTPATDINQSWGSGWGVRLLERLVSKHYEGRPDA